MSDNISFNDIVTTYKTLVTSATKELNEWKEKIGTKEVTPQETLLFNAAVSNWEMVNSASNKALSSVADTLKEGLRQR